MRVSDMGKGQTETYHFKPTGRKVAPTSREYKEPSRELEKAFEQWLDRVSSSTLWEDDYKSACELIEGLRPSVDEAHTLLVSHCDHPKIVRAGLFASAVHNKVRDKIIVYDLKLETPPQNLAYKLAKGKLFINNGSAGDWMGWGAKAPTINNGSAGDLMGELAKAPTINNGGWGMGEHAESLVIALKEPKGYGQLGKGGRLIRPVDCEQVAELREYLENIKMRTSRLGRPEATEEDYRWVAGLDGEQMTKDIEAILRRAGKGGYMDVIRRGFLKLLSR